MLRTTRIRHSFPILAALALLASAPRAAAYTETAIHSFCAASNCIDGDDPLAGLVGDASGNLYGTTQKGGKFSSGVVFKLVPNGSGYQEFILHNFCSHPNCGDGGFPRGDLILDKDGNLYGTAPSGGAHNAGVVFRLRHGINGWAFGVLHNFCNQTSCTDASFPSTGLSYSHQIAGKPWNETEPLFGTTDNGGAHNRGTVFELVPNGSGGWSYSVLHSFNPAANSAQPGPVLVDPSSGDLFGQTLLGGSVHGGLLYRLTANTWSETVLHNFCSQTNCADGSEGNGRLLLNGAGNLIGITSLGGTGAQCTDSNGCGVVFERTQAGNFKVLYNFCSAANCKDGRNPAAGLIADSQGNLFGTTYRSNKGGTLYMLTHANSSWSETVLYDFCSLLNCADGAGPVAPVIQDAGGNLFGTGSTGGAHGDHGVVYELTGLSGP